jgi:hypothetical protein
MSQETNAARHQRTELRDNVMTSQGRISFANGRDH